MLTIRFFRVGKKNQPAFKIIVTDKRNSSARGRFVEEVGFYDPLTKEKILKADRIKHWLSVGAQPSETVHNLLVSEGIIEGEKIDVHKKPKKLKEDKSSSRPSPSEKGSEKEESAKEKAPAPEPTPKPAGPAEEKVPVEEEALQAEAQPEEKPQP